MKNALRALLKNTPFLLPLLRYFFEHTKKLKKNQSLTQINNLEVFHEIYKNNAWGDNESLSGAGSNLNETENLIAILPSIFEKYKIESVLDLPCGDFNWFKEVNINEIRYYGGDIVSDLIDKNRQYESSSISFSVIDLVNDPLPKVSLIIVRDCFVHMPYDDIFNCLRNICNSGSEYLLTTTFTKQVSNKDILSGQWRPLNLHKDPFFFSKELMLINEDYPGFKWVDKSLALWDINSIEEILNLNEH